MQKSVPPNWQVTVQAPEGPIPGYVQFDKLNPDGSSYESSSREQLQAEGYLVPDFSRLPTGRYSFEQARKLGFQMLRQRMLDDKAATAKIAQEHADARSVRLQAPDRGDIVISPSTEFPGKFQLTWFDKLDRSAPNGHAVYPSMQEALLSAMGQFTPSNGPPHGSSTYRPVKIMHSAARKTLEAVFEMEAMPLRTFIVTIANSINRPWQKYRVNAVSVEAAWKKLAKRTHGVESDVTFSHKDRSGCPAPRGFNRDSSTRATVLRKNSNGIIGYVDLVLPEK